MLPLNFVGAQCFQSGPAASHLDQQPGCSDRDNCVGWISASPLFGPSALTSDKQPQLTPSWTSDGLRSPNHSCGSAEPVLRDRLPEINLLQETVSKKVESNRNPISSIGTLPSGSSARYSGTCCSCFSNKIHRVSGATTARVERRQGSWRQARRSLSPQGDIALLFGSIGLMAVYS